MGYDLHVTRAEFWAENDASPIDADEWLALVDADPSLTIDARNGPYFALTGSDEDSGWIDWSEGDLYSKYPDRRTFEKLLQIAEVLSARVQGDDGEIYHGIDDFPARADRPPIGPDTGDSLPRYEKRRRIYEWIVIAVVGLVIAAANVFDWW